MTDKSIKDQVHDCFKLRTPVAVRNLAIERDPIGFLLSERKRYKIRGEERKPGEFYEPRANVISRVTDYIKSHVLEILRAYDEYLISQIVRMPLGRRFFIIPNYLYVYKIPVKAVYNKHGKMIRGPSWRFNFRFTIAAFKKIAAQLEPPDESICDYYKSKKYSDRKSFDYHYWNERVSMYQSNQEVIRRSKRRRDQLLRESKDRLRAMDLNKALSDKPKK